MVRRPITVLMLASVIAVTAAGATPEARLDLGLRAFRAADYASAAVDLSAAADAALGDEQLRSYVETGRLEAQETFEIALVYLALAQFRLGQEDEARDTILRLAAAEQISPLYAELPLQAEAAEFETLAAALTPTANLPRNLQIAAADPSAPLPAVTPATPSAETVPSTADEDRAARQAAVDLFRVQENDRLQRQAAARLARATAPPSAPPVATATSDATGAERRAAELEAQRRIAANEEEARQRALAEERAAQERANAEREAAARIAAEEAARRAAELDAQRRIAANEEEARQRALAEERAAQERANAEREAQRRIAANEEEARQRTLAAERAEQERIARERMAIEREAADRVAAAQAEARAAEEREAQQRALATQESRERATASDADAVRRRVEAEREAERQNEARRVDAQRRTTTVDATSAPTLVATTPTSERDDLISLRQAEALAENNRLREANVIYERLATSQHVARDVLIGAAIGLYRTGAYREAAGAFQRLSGFARGEEDLRYYHAVSLYESGQFEAARKELLCALPFLQVTEAVTRYRAKIEQTAALTSTRN
jgi:hypothetical protein